MLCNGGMYSWSVPISKACTAQYWNPAADAPQAHEQSGGQ